MLIHFSLHKHICVKIAFLHQVLVDTRLLDVSQQSKQGV